MYRAPSCRAARPFERRRHRAARFSPATACTTDAECVTGSPTCVTRADDGAISATDACKGGAICASESSLGLPSRYCIDPFCAPPTETVSVADVSCTDNNATPYTDACQMRKAMMMCHLVAGAYTTGPKKNYPECFAGQTVLMGANNQMPVNVNQHAEVYSTLYDSHSTTMSMACFINDNSGERLATVFAVAGTKGWQDAFKDANLNMTNFQVEVAGGGQQSFGRAHCGFYRVLTGVEAPADCGTLAGSVQKPVLPWANGVLASLGGKYGKYGIICTGHSLGAGVSGMLSLALTVRYPSVPVQFIGIATPPIGDNDLANFATGRSADANHNFHFQKFASQGDPVGLVPAPGKYSRWGGNNNGQCVVFGCESSSGVQSAVTTRASYYQLSFVASRHFLKYYLAAFYAWLRANGPNVSMQCTLAPQRAVVRKVDALGCPAACHQPGPQGAPGQPGTGTQAGPGIGDWCTKSGACQWEGTSPWCDTDAGQCTDPLYPVYLGWSKYGDGGHCDSGMKILCGASGEAEYNLDFAGCPEECGGGSDPAQCSASGKCTWYGTATACGGHLDDCGGSTYYGFSERGDGKTCLSGHKVLCGVYDYDKAGCPPGCSGGDACTADGDCKWYGTAWTCHGTQSDCTDNNSTLVAQSESGDGKTCWTGHKVLCKPNSG